MTALQLNAELYRVISQIADDETLLTKMLRYARRLVSQEDKRSLTEKPLTREERTALLKEQLKSMAYKKKAVAPWVDKLVSDIPTMPADVDIDQLKYNHLMEKYG